MRSADPHPWARTRAAPLCNPWGPFPGAETRSLRLSLPGARRRESGLSAFGFGLFLLVASVLLGLGAPRSRLPAALLRLPHT